MAIKSAKKKSSFDLFVQSIANEALFNVDDSKLQGALNTVQSAADNADNLEDISALDLKLTTETEKFNASLGEFEDLAQQYRSGQIDKETLAGRASPIMDELKATTVVLGLDSLDGSVSDPITEEEVASLRAFLLAAKEIISKRKTQLEGHVKDDTNTAFVPEDDLGDGPEGDISADATEGFLESIGKYRIATESAKKTASAPKKASKKAGLSREALEAAYKLGLTGVQAKIYAKAYEEVEDVVEDGADPDRTNPINSEAIVDEIIDPEVTKRGMAEDIDEDDVDPEEIEAFDEEATEAVRLLLSDL
jgi:hypothetical protein